METTKHVMQQVRQAKCLLDDPLTSASDLDLEVLAAQSSHHSAPELERQVIAEMTARMWARSAA